MIVSDLCIFSKSEIANSWTFIGKDVVMLTDLRSEDDAAAGDAPSASYRVSHCSVDPEVDRMITVSTDIFSDSILTYILFSAVMHRFITVIKFLWQPISDDKWPIFLKTLACLGPGIKPRPASPQALSLLIELCSLVTIC